MAIELQGLEEVLNKIGKLGDTAKINSALGKACALVERAAKEKAPKGDTGELRRSITSEVKDYQGIIYTPLEYAPYVEYGTGLFAENGGRQNVPWKYQDDRGEWHKTIGQKQKPYMRTALNENREEIKRILEGALKND